MFLPPGADNPSYATASARQCKCGRFKSASVGNERLLRCRPILRPHPTAGLWSPVPGGWSAIAPLPPAAFPACVSTRAPRHWRPSCCPPFCMPIHPRRRPIVQQRPLGRAAIPRLTVQWLIGHCTSLVMLREQHRGPAVNRSPSPPSRPCWRSNSDCGKRYVLGRNRESRLRPGNCDSRPGNVISRELTSLANTDPNVTYPPNITTLSALHLYLAFIPLPHGIPTSLHFTKMLRLIVAKSPVCLLLLY